MGKTRTLKYKFSEKHKDYMRRCRNAAMSVAEGAVRSGKTVDHVFVFAALLEDAPDKLHLATGSTIANAKLNIGDCNGFGLEGIFRGRCRWGKYKDNECLRVKTRTGEKVVIFAGGAKADSFKKIRGNSYGMWIATEINLHHDNTIKEAMNRQLAATRRRIFWDLNPEAPGAWIYMDYLNKYDAQQVRGEFPGGYCYGHFTIRDNAALPEGRMAEIIAQYDPTSVWYRRDILGERCAAEGLVYPMFDRQKHVVDKYDDRGLWYISIDYGTMNPCSMGLWCISNGVAVRTAEFYHDGRRTRRQLTDEEYYTELEKLAGKRMIQHIIVDPSAASFIACIRRHGRFRVRGAENDVVPGIRATGSMIQAGKVLIHESCVDCIREIQSYSWDTKSGEDKVIKENDHAMDDMRYFCNTVLRRELRHGIV